jgi:hypothetical protein
MFLVERFNWVNHSDRSEFPIPGSAGSCRGGSPTAILTGGSAFRDRLDGESLQIEANSVDD